MRSAQEQNLLPVVCAFASRNAKVLVALRAPPHRHAGLWEFPGGKIEEGERPEEALARELWEEIRVRAQVGEHIATGRDEFVKIDCYEVHFEENPIAVEHAMLAWVEVDELNRLPMPPADSEIVAAVLRIYEGA